MKHVLDFLSNNPALAICVCLALGYCIGFIKIKTFSFGSTIGTLVVGFVLSRFTSFEIPGILVTVFSLLFCFTLGYEAGPAFFKSLKSNGIKFILHAIVFTVASFLLLYAIGASGLLDRDTVIGVAAGALTQTSILTVAEGLGDMASIAYATTYMTGTLLAILIASVIGHMLLKTSPISAVRQKTASAQGHNTISDKSGDVRLDPIFPRAYLIEKGSCWIGKTIEELEDGFEHTLEVVKLFRDEKEIAPDQDLILESGDVITVISTIRHMMALDDEYLREVGDSRYLSLNLTSKEIVITETYDGSLVDLLSAHGIVLHSVVLKNGKKEPISDALKAQKSMVIRVSGVESSIRKAAGTLGYIKEIGSVTDVPFLFTALAASIVFGALKFFGFGLGDSTCALIIGLVCGWYCNKNPKYGQFPEGTRWFLTSVGLNIFIAVKALTTGIFALDAKMLMILGIGIVVTLVPHIFTLLFSKYVLKMDDADILGSQCGSGTCNAALNALTDGTGSSVFIASFATTNAVANISLTVLGVLLAILI